MQVLDPELVLRAYAIGVFPMSDSRDADEVFWVEPRRRAILPIDGFRMSRSLRKTIRSETFKVTCDLAFADVLRRCSERDETWINGIIERSFNNLHRLGHAHSVECWMGDRLVGGLYGVKLGAAFFGESMFSLERDASKVALAWLVARLKVGGFALLDCQFMTEHLRSLGALEIDQSDYVALLSSALSSGAGAGDGAGAAGLDLLGAARGVEFGALDRLLASSASGSSEAAAPGWVISQLLGQTS